MHRERSIPYAHRREDLFKSNSYLNHLLAQTPHFFECSLKDYFGGPDSEAKAHHLLPSAGISPVDHRVVARNGNALHARICDSIFDLCAMSIFEALPFRPSCCGCKAPPQLLN